MRRAVLADTGPRPCSPRSSTRSLPARYLAGLRRFRYGTGVFKVDLALDGPVPWSARAWPTAGVVHLTGDLDDMAPGGLRGPPRRRARPAHAHRRPADRWPTPAGRPPAATPCGSRPTSRRARPRGRGRRPGTAFLDVVLDRLEAHAPGLRGRIVGTRVRTPDDLEGENPNLVGGDLGAGSRLLDQQLVFRPVPGLVPLRHAGAGPLPVLGVDPPRRRRPRHGRAQLRPAGARRPATSPDLSGPQGDGRGLAPPLRDRRTPLTGSGHSG